MPNKLLRTLTIDGVPNDALGVGDYLQLDANNDVALRTNTLQGEFTARSIPNNTNVEVPCFTANVDGIYIVTFNVGFVPNSNGQRYALPLHNGAGANSCRVRMQATSSGYTIVGAVWAGYLPKNDVISIQVNQTSGGNLNMSGGSYRAFVIPRVGG